MRLNRIAGGKELADERRRAARSVRQLGRLRGKSRRYNFYCRDQMLPNDGGLNLWLCAAGLVEKDADVAVVIVVDGATGPESWRSKPLMKGGQAMVVMTVLRNKPMQAIPQHGNAAVKNK